MNKALAALGLPRWSLSYVEFLSVSKREYNFLNILPAADGAVLADHDYHIDYLRWRYYGIQKLYISLNLISLYCRVNINSKNIFPVAIFWVRIANSIMHDTDLAGVGLISTRYWPFVGVWLQNSYGVANVQVATRQQTLRSLLNLSVTETSGH